MMLGKLNIHTLKREIRHLSCRIYFKINPKQILYKYQSSSYLLNYQEKHKRNFLATAWETAETQAFKETIDRGKCTKNKTLHNKENNQQNQETNQRAGNSIESNTSDKRLASKKYKDPEQLSSKKQES